MVKRGGTKKKIKMEKITKKLSIAPTFTKRRKGLFSKASQLCLLSGAHIAVLATPPSSKSNVSFYSFGHSSVDTVVSAYLSGQRHVPVLEENNKQTREDVGICLTRKDLGLGLWWEDESLIRSENPEELRDAMDSMWTLLSDLKGLKTNVNNDRRDHYTHQAFVNDDEDLKKKKEKIDVVVLDNGTQEPDQTLILQSTTSPADCCIPDDYNKITEEQYQINEICESFSVSDYNNTLPQGNNNAEGFLDYDQVTDIDELIDFDYIFENSPHLDLEEVAASLLSSSELLHADHGPMETTTDTMMCLEDEFDFQFPMIFSNQPLHHFEDDLCNFPT
ncbi:Agamous-like MADS-box protein AGL97 [Cardamine amara subsp. amara]|uniref:Agamous-like MADS-box protein AGL97 n=1 Tax=Cardamine amara subsp. amara TaxID=228776 RepID=A0ABD0Z8D1_CARAN